MPLGAWAQRWAAVAVAVLAIVGSEPTLDEQQPTESGLKTPSEELPPKKVQPSFVIAVTDQERYPTAYDGDEATAYRKNHFAGDRLLCENRPCMRFSRHYTAATACTPARSSLYTGLYARVHQALQTTGLKQADDEDIQWLDPSFGTMGDYFRAAGYETVYFGEWHLSAEKDMSEDVSESTGNNRRNPEDLDKYGFSSWVEPDVPVPKKSKDDAIVAQATRWLEERAQRNETAPFLLVVNLNSPGDIQHWPTQYKKSNQGRAGLQGGPTRQVPIPGLPPTLKEDLSEKAATTRQAGRVLDSALQPLPQFMHRWHGFAQAYMLFQKDADDQLARLTRAVEASFPLSVVVRTSDTGEMGGAHGGMRGKWYNGYEETIHVPLIISGPHVAAHRGTIDDISSSVDILPTLLAIAQVNVKAIEEKVFSHHHHASLPGRNLLVRRPEKEQVAFFETYDHVTRHQQSIVPLAQCLGPWIEKVSLLRTLLSSEELDTTTNIEAVVAKPGGDTRAGYPGRGGKVWKLIRFWDDPEKWSQPGIVHQPRRGQQKGRFYRASKRTQQHADELELYDLDKDPFEEHNLAYNHEYHAVLVSMQSVLNASRPLFSSPPTKLPQPQIKVPSECKVSISDIIIAVLYLVKRTEREFPYGSVKFLIGLVIGFRLIGPYRLSKRLLAHLAFPINLMSGVVHLMLGLVLLCDHVYAFPPFLPLLPDALAHESAQVYIVLGILTILSGATRLAYVIFGTSRGASVLIVCMTWIAEWALLILLLQNISNFDILDFLFPFALPVIAASATLCLGDVPGLSWRMFIIRALALVITTVLLSYFALAHILMQQGLITERIQVLDMSWATLTLYSIQLREAGVSQALVSYWAQLRSFAGI